MKILNQLFNCIVVLIVPISLMCQTLTRTSIASLSLMNDEQAVLFESGLGQSFTNSYINDEFSLGEGFHHRSAPTSTYSTDVRDQPLIEVYPNPVAFNLRLHLVTQSTMKVNIKIYAISGSVLLEEKHIFNGEKLLNWDVSNWSSGTYTIHCISDDKHWIHRQLFVKT